MGLESLHLIVILTLIGSQAIASYVPYVQYAGSSYSTPAYITSYPVPSYTTAPAPIYTKPYTQPVPNFQFQSPPSFQTAPNFQPLPKIQSAPNSQSFPTTPLAAPAGYSSAASGYTPTFSATSAPTTADAASPPIPKATAYQAAPYQQPVKASSVAPSSVPIPPKLEPIKAEPYIPKETLPKANPLPKDLLSNVPAFDSNILNNLAIALQLLIVSNLIHNPPPESNPTVKDINKDFIPAVAPLPIPYVPPNTVELPSHSHYSIPNANFIGSSSFGDTGISKSMMNAYGSPTIPAPRPLGLMSPYDAIGPNSPYSNIFPSKVESRSPYHLSSDYNDLFSLTELFKVR